VNRKDRRAARSKSKPAPGGAAGLGAGAMAGNLFAAAVEHFNAGRLDEAERLCRDVLMFNRGHFDAMHMLGIIATRYNNLAGATEILGRALAINPRSPECHFNLAQVLRNQGRHAEAFDHLGQATTLRPGYVSAQLALADMLAQQNALDEARARYEQALAAEPQLVEARHSLANLLRQQGRIDEAADQFQQVIAQRPDYAEARNNFGVLLATQGRFAEAAEQYQQALSLKPDLVDTYRNLARALLGIGRADEAVAAVMRGLALRETDEAKAAFVQCAQNITSVPDDARFRDLIARALTEGWGRSAELSPLAAFMFATGEPGRSVMDRVLNAPLPEASAELLSGLSQDRLLQALLESAPVRSVPLERFLTVIRSALLQTGLQADAHTAVDEPLLAFACALARQCFNNQYVFAESDTDQAQTDALRQRIAAALAADAPVSALWLAVVACFVPLDTLPRIEVLTARPWPESLRALLVQQVEEPATERELAAAIPALTPIEDAVSVAVRGQYEEMPYPRWVKLPVTGHPTPLEDYLRGQFPAAPIRPLENSDGLDVLVAGCGTGQHAIETAQRFAGAHVLAVDLSRGSLGYAARKTKEARLRNIEYMHGDILNLGGLNARFDLIEASGVLHHMRDPAQGWHVLLALLRPRGFMHIGLYSAAARADIRATRALIEERGYGNTAADIRRCRQELLGYPDGTPYKNVTGYSDFFTTGDCRDLLFHVQEHQVTIPAIKAFLAETGLIFIGFAGPVSQLYRQMFPDDASLTDLDRWHEFETANPMAFVNMYQFWVQAP
jgi:tetratricopeptide (TPR) repeat protein/SAM-dependent methyltransferase